MSIPKLNDHRREVVWWRAYTVEISIVILGLAAMNGIFVARAFRQTSTVSREAAAQLGSFVGGYVGTMFALTGVVLLYVTLRSQLRSSSEQSFENKYFELLKMHRDNVAELEVRGASGRKLFVLLLRELRCILDIVRTVAQESSQQLTQVETLHVAYYCLFYGVGPNSSRMLRMSLSTFDSEFVEVIDKTLSDPEIKLRVRNEQNFDYVPFDGHQSRLGHYYRHLYQMVRYVDEKQLTIDKYEYVKTVRAQLSTHEQALLLVNSLTPNGQDWWRKNLIVKYRLVQNLPREFFDSSTEIDLSTLFEPGYFEWEEAERGTAVPGPQDSR